MSLDREVFLSLLALDAYNRGPRPGLANLELPNLDGQGRPTEDIRIGRAQVLSGSEAILGPDSVAAGFAAVAYEWNGETIISYRGTNFPGGIEVADLDRTKVPFDHPHRTSRRPSGSWHPGQSQRNAA